MVPHLPKGGGPRIVNVGSSAARRPRPLLSAYAASKGGLEALGRVWAVELGADGHTVNTVAPGPTETDMLAPERRAPAFEAFEEKILGETPLGHRFGTPEDVALVVAAVAGPGMRWVTGQTICASAGGGGGYDAVRAIRSIRREDYLMSARSSIGTS